MAYRLQMILLWIGVFIVIDHFVGDSAVVSAVVGQIDSWNTSMRYQVSHLLGTT